MADKMDTKLEDLNATVQNLARARMDCAAANGETDKTVVGYIDAILFPGLNDGAKEAKELVISESLPTKAEETALSAFFSTRWHVLEFLTLPSDNGTDDANVE